MNTADLVKKLCDEKGISIHKLEVDLGFSNGSLKKAKSLPFERIVAIAEYFHIKIDYFLPNEEPPIPVGITDERTDRALEFIERFDKASPEIQAAIRTLLGDHRSDS